MICTFSEDWHYHARTIVGGSPSIISTTGIVEAPAKPPTNQEWYIKQMQLATHNIYSDGDENDVISSDGKEKYLDYGDYRINFVAVGSSGIIFFITEGNPFCNNIADFIMHTGKKN
jgi:hypothetical protein